MFFIQMITASSESHWGCRYHNSRACRSTKKKCCMVPIWQNLNSKTRVEFSPQPINWFCSTPFNQCWTWIVKAALCKIIDCWLSFLDRQISSLWVAGQPTQTVHIWWPGNLAICCFKTKPEVWCLWNCYGVDSCTVCLSARALTLKSSIKYGLPGPYLSLFMSYIWLIMAL